MDPPIDPIDYRYRMKEKKPIVCCFCPMRPCVLAILLVLIPLLFVALYLSIYESQYIYVIVSSGKPTVILNANEKHPTGKIIHGERSDKNSHETILTEHHAFTDKHQSSIPPGKVHQPGNEEKTEHKEFAHNQGTSDSVDKEGHKIIDQVEKPVDKKGDISVKKDEVDSTSIKEPVINKDKPTTENIANNIQKGNKEEHMTSGNSTEKAKEVEETDKKDMKVDITVKKDEVDSNSIKEPVINKDKPTAENVANNINKDNKEEHVASDTSKEKAKEEVEETDDEDEDDGRKTKQSASSLLDQLIAGITNLYYIFRENASTEANDQPSESTENNKLDENIVEDSKEEVKGNEKGKEKDSLTLLDSLVTAASDLVSFFNGKETEVKEDKDKVHSHDEEEKHHGKVTEGKSDSATDGNTSKDKTEGHDKKEKQSENNNKQLDSPVLDSIISAASEIYNLVKGDDKTVKKETTDKGETLKVGDRGNKEQLNSTPINNVNHEHGKPIEDKEVSKKEGKGETSETLSNKGEKEVKNDIIKKTDKIEESAQPGAPNKIVDNNSITGSKDIQDTGKKVEPFTGSLVNDKMVVKENSVGQIQKETESAQASTATPTQEKHPADHESHVINQNENPIIISKKPTDEHEIEKKIPVNKGTGPVVLEVKGNSNEIHGNKFDSIDSSTNVIKKPNVNDASSIEKPNVIDGAKEKPAPASKSTTDKGNVDENVKHEPSTQEKLKSSDTDIQRPKEGLVEDSKKENGGQPAAGKQLEDLKKNTGKEDEHLEKGINSKPTVVANVVKTDSLMSNSEKNHESKALVEKEGGSNGNGQTGLAEDLKKEIMGGNAATSQKPEISEAKIQGQTNLAGTNYKQETGSASNNLQQSNATIPVKPVMVDAATQTENGAEIKESKGQNILVEVSKNGHGTVVPLIPYTSGPEILMEIKEAKKETKEQKDSAGNSKKGLEGEKLAQNQATGETSAEDAKKLQEKKTILSQSDMSKNSVEEIKDTAKEQKSTDPKKNEVEKLAVHENSENIHTQTEIKDGVTSETKSVLDDSKKFKAENKVVSGTPATSNTPLKTEETKHNVKQEIESKEMKASDEISKKVQENLVPHTSNPAVLLENKQSVKDSKEQSGSAEASLNLPAKETVLHEKPVSTDAAVQTENKAGSIDHKEVKVSDEESKKVQQEKQTSSSAVEKETKEKIKEAKDSSSSVEDSKKLLPENSANTDSAVKVKEIQQSIEKSEGNKTDMKASDGSQIRDEHVENAIHGEKKSTTDTKIEGAKPPAQENSGEPPGKNAPAKVESKYDLLNFKISNPNACPNKGSNLNLLIVISSPVENVLSRNDIRKTWGEMAKLQGFHYMFIVGSQPNDVHQNSLEEESNENHDILQTNVADADDKQTERSIMLVKWLKNSCPFVEFVLKVQDDTFLNCPKIDAYVKSLIGKGEKRSMHGSLGRWIDDVINGPIKSPMDYLQDGAYMFSGSLTGELYDGAEYELTVPLENLFLTGILAKKLKIHLVDVPQFSENKSKVPSVDPCEIFQSAMVLRSYRPNEMVSFWNQLQNRNFCKEKYLMTSPNSTSGADNLMYSSSLNNKKFTTESVPPKNQVQEISF